MKSIIIFIDYFGQWPAWFDMFLESCRANATIHWCVHTDCMPPENPPANVRFIHTSFSNYCAKVSRVLGVGFTPDVTYNICNLKPMVGYVYQDLLEGYDYYGWGDIDVIYGNIRSIYGARVLEHSVISTHRHICSGHLTLVKNEPWLREAFRYLTGWEARLENHLGFDWHESLAEARLTALFCPVEKTRERFSDRFATRAPDRRFFDNNYFQEQWSTPFTPKVWIGGAEVHPDTWCWNNGVLTNDRDGNRTFLYLHLMNFKSKRWVNERLYGNAPTWNQLSNCMHFDARDLTSRNDSKRLVRIDRLGIHLV